MDAFRVVTCQFPVSANIRSNGRRMAEMVQTAANSGADVIHFPESALSSYAGVAFQSWQGFGWPALQQESENLVALARQYHVWLLFGSAHRLTMDHLPHNSIYAVNPRGEVVESYDKLFCTPRDLELYTPGDHLALFEIGGLRCGILVCHYSRYPELYGRYYLEGVCCLVQSFYDAGATGRTIRTATMRLTMQAHAATNCFWISVSNTSGFYQSWVSVFIVPDGELRNRCGSTELEG